VPALTCVDVWEHIARAIPDADAVIQGDLVRSWGEYDDRAGRLAAHFQSTGLTAGSTVGIFMFNSPEYLDAHYAALKLRAVPINVNYRYLDAELTYLLTDAGCEAVVFHSSLAERIAAVAPSLPRVRTWIEVADDEHHIDLAVRYDEVIAAHHPRAPIERFADDVYMLYTGGTTGMPKGVQYRMGSMTQFFVQSAAARAGVPVPVDAAAAATTAAQMVASGTAPRTIPCCPLMHGTGIWLGAVGPHLLGGASVLTESGRFAAREVWSAVEQHRANTLIIVGDVFAKPLLDDLERGSLDGRPIDTSSVHSITSSGAMFSIETKRRLIDWMPALSIRDVLGASEGAMGYMVTTASSLDTATASFMPNPGVIVINDNDQPVAPGSGEIGVVASTGGNVPIGYHNDATKSSATFREINGARYAIHGDMAMVHGDGSITLLGRGSQCINTGGEKVFPEEVEESLKSCVGVRDALVFGVADERFGQRIVAVASLDATGNANDDAPELITERIIEHARARLSGYKVPRKIALVGDVPRFANGKADYETACRVSGFKP
jgi:3-oxocholest-4-en-26-oate---CoA ligase